MRASATKKREGGVEKRNVWIKNIGKQKRREQSLKSSLPHIPEGEEVRYHMLTLKVKTAQGVPSWSSSQLPFVESLLYNRFQAGNFIYIFLNWNIRYPSKDLLLLKEGGNLKTLT